jgi:hypothetical protein
MQRNEDKAFPAEGDQQACGLNRTSYPNPATEKKAMEYLLDARREAVASSELGKDVIDDLYHFIRYGLAEYDPRTGKLRWCGPPHGSEEMELRMALMNSETIPGYPTQEGNN